MVIFPKFGFDHFRRPWEGTSRTGSRRGRFRGGRTAVCIDNHAAKAVADGVWQGRRPRAACRFLKSGGHVQRTCTRRGGRSRWPPCTAEVIGRDARYWRRGAVDEGRRTPTPALGCCVTAWDEHHVRPVAGTAGRTNRAPGRFRLRALPASVSSGQVGADPTGRSVWAWLAVGSAPSL